MSKIPIKMPLDIVEGSECLDNEVAWMVPEALYKLDDELKENDVVLEFGSGGSTLFFARRCGYVKSVETSKEWYDKVLHTLSEKDIRAPYKLFEKEEEVVGYARMNIHKDVSVLSVDTQGGYNRSKILDAFLENGISQNLRMIILDNYSHEGLFPDHYNKDNFIGDGWEVFTYLHPRWAGDGTKILIRK